MQDEKSDENDAFVDERAQYLTAIPKTDANNAQNEKDINPDIQISEKIFVSVAEKPKIIIPRIMDEDIIESFNGNQKDVLNYKYSKYNDPKRYHTRKLDIRQLQIVFRTPIEISLYNAARDAYPKALNTILKRYLAQLIINDIPLEVALNISLKNLANASNIAENEQQLNKPLEDD